jgi:hypothetical protein
MDVSNIWHLQQRLAPFLNLANHSKTCILPTFCSTKATVNISKLAVAINPQFKVKLDAVTLFFQVCDFLGMCKSQMEQHVPVLNMTLLNNHMCCKDVPSRKWLSRLYSIYMELYKFVLAAVLLSCGQSRNYLIASCTTYRVTDCV